MPEFPEKLDWLNTAPIKLSRVICFELESLFSETKVVRIALILIKFFGRISKEKWLCWIFGPIVV